MYCGHCGARMRKNAQFCPACGEIAEDTAERDINGNYTGRNPRFKTGRKGTLLLIIGLIVLLLGIVACVLYYRHTQNQPVEEEVFITGQASYTDLITCYLEQSSANDTQAILELFFPNAQDCYQDEEATLSALQILKNLDSCYDCYGLRAVSAELEDAVFIDLTDSSAQSVLTLVQTCYPLEQISELYTVDASVSYYNGTSVVLTFQVLQCEYGCYLISVQQAQTTGSAQTSQ